ncbi:MAG TPA: hypothetical protein VLR71_19485 [Casimicrobiaceae bacterium]|nr:hypothetical protein [Casimicrobiaceae bacterium]
MKPSQPNVRRHIVAPLTGIMVGAAGGSLMWILAALIMWAVTH